MPSPDWTVSVAFMKPAHRTSPLPYPGKQGHPNCQGMKQVETNFKAVIYSRKDKNMNRYDYYTRCVNFDEQEWLIEELYYPEQEEYSSYDPYEPSSSQEYTEDYDDYYFCSPYDEDEEEDEDWAVNEDENWVEDEDWAEDESWHEDQEDGQDKNDWDKDDSKTAIQAQQKGEELA